MPDPAGYESFGRNPSKWPAALLAADKDRVMRSNEKLVLTKIDLCEGLGICPRAVQSYVSDPPMNFPKRLRGVKKRMWSGVSVDALDCRQRSARQ